jgi:hypothetical protein
VEHRYALLISKQQIAMDIETEKLKKMPFNKQLVFAFAQGRE